MKTVIFFSLAILIILVLGWLSVQPSGAAIISSPTPKPTPTPLPTPGPGMYANPVLDRDFPDPDVLQVGDVFYAYATNAGSTNIQAARSTDLVHWDMLPDALPLLPTWAMQDFGWAWAPEVTALEDGTTIMYHAARLGGAQCIGAAISDSPEGPFEPVGEEPLICQTEQGGSIDPAAFTDDDGRRYILWKNDGNALGGKTWLYIQEIESDGLTLIGEPVQLLERSESWEGRLVEAPTLWKREGTYYLFYSANDYSSPRYAVGYATSDHVLGPYTKPGSEPVLSSNIGEGLFGPGGQDLIRLPDGSEWMLYHGWVPDGRALYLSPVLWENGVPSIPVQRAPQPVPLP
jgi:beta-xylosidase